MPKADLVHTFLQERQLLKNVALTTIDSYQRVMRRYSDCLLNTPGLPTVAAIKNQLMEYAQKGMRATTLNIDIRTLNAFLKWSEEEGYADRKLRIGLMKVPQTLLEPFRQKHVQTLMSVRVAGRNLRRAQAMATIIFDGGLRISEVLDLKRSDLDFERGLLKVQCGKGRKGRIVPVSDECQALLKKWLCSHDDELLFCTDSGKRLGYDNSRRDLQALCKRAGVVGPRITWHNMRHSFGLSYIASGGDPFSLQEIMGHADLATTRRYVRLQTDDLVRKHSRHSTLLRGASS